MEPAVPNGAAAAAEPPAAAVREQDRLMPIANVIRIMRRVLPPHAKISDDAKELIQECVSEFISFVTGEANERCHGEHRKTVTAEDVVWAMDRLGFDDYVLPLSVYLQRMRECEGGGGGGDRAVPRAPPRAAPRPVCTLPAPGHGVQVQVQQAVYAPPAPAQAYAAVAMQPVPANAPPHVIGQYGVFGCQLPVDAPYYGENGAYGAGGGRGGCADESSSSSTRAPAPAVGTGSQ